MMHVITIDEELIQCDGLTCEPAKNYICGTHCKDCPIVAEHETMLAHDLDEEFEDLFPILT